jgi:hypothetical protein
MRIKILVKDRFVSRSLARMLEAIGTVRRRCKCFKPKYKTLEDEFFAADFRVSDRSIEFAEGWNEFCKVGKAILVTKGDVKRFGDRTFLVEPLIRYFTTFSSNNGWIASEDEEG